MKGEGIKRTGKGGQVKGKENSEEVKWRREDDLKIGKQETEVQNQSKKREGGRRWIQGTKKTEREKVIKINRFVTK